MKWRLPRSNFARKQSRLELVNTHLSFAYTLGKSLGIEIRKIPAGEAPIVGGEMEGIGLLGLSETPVWCIVKGVSDFAEIGRAHV